jgi:two-component system response regulator DegU
LNFIKLLIIDKEAFFRATMVQELSLEGTLEIFGTDPGPGEDLFALIEARSPDVALLDIDFPSLSGIKLGKILQQRYPSMKLIMLTPKLDNEELFQTIKLGAVAYVSKNSAKLVLLDTIARAARGQYPINDSLMTNPQVAEHVLRQFQEMASLWDISEPIAAPLTSRETQILRHIASGNSNKRIAQILQISEQTIKNHVSSIFRKLNANDRAHAVVLAFRRGWIPTEERPAS